MLQKCRKHDWSRMSDFWLEKSKTTLELILCTSITSIRYFIYFRGNSNRFLSITAKRWRWERFTSYESSNILLHKPLSAPSFGRSWKQLIGPLFLHTIPILKNLKLSGNCEKVHKSQKYYFELKPMLIYSLKFFFLDSKNHWKLPTLGF